MLRGTWPWFKTTGIPFWLVGEFTTHFRTYFSGWIESDVHWGVRGFDPWPLPTDLQKRTALVQFLAKQNPPGLSIRSQPWMCVCARVLLMHPFRCCFEGEPNPHIFWGCQQEVQALPRRRKASYESGLLRNQICLTDQAENEFNPISVKDSG